MFVFLKFLHISAMFAATSLAVGPIVVYYLIARTGDASALKTAMKFDEALERTAGGFYGLGILLGVAAVLSGGLDLSAPWLLTAYALVVLLIANNLYLSFRMRALREVASSGNTVALRALSRARALTASITALGLITLALVYTMVAKPSFLASAVVLAHIGNEKLGQLAGRTGTHDRTHGIFRRAFARTAERRKARSAPE